jgi:hypothetical protein
MRAHMRVAIFNMKKCIYIHIRLGKNLNKIKVLEKA